MKIGPETVLINKLTEADYKRYIAPARMEVIKAIQSLQWPPGTKGFYFHPKSRTKTIGGKKVGGNGVAPIKKPFIDSLKSVLWVDEFSLSTSEDIVTNIKVIKKFGTSKTLIYGTIESLNRTKGEILYKDRSGKSVKALLDPDFESELTDKELEGKLVSMRTAKPGDLDVCKKIEDQLFVVEWETGNISSSHRALNKMSLLLLKGHIIGGILVVPNRRMYSYLTDRIGNYEELKPYFDLWRSIGIGRGYLEVIAIEHDGLSDEAPIIEKGRDGRAAK